MKTLIQNLVRAHDGPLTRDLLLSPSGHGLGRLPHRLQPDVTTTSVCGYCSTGCGLRIHMKDGEAIGLSPSTEYPVNLGMACPKGWEALAVLDSPDRATSPMIRGGDGLLKPTDWDTALRLFCDRFKAVQVEHGDASVAFLSTGQIVTEEMALLGALAKFGMGMVHGDGNTRQCMATAAVAYKQSLGFDAPPFSYADFEQSDVIVLIGSNLCIAHPILWERIVRNPNQPRIIAIDPRKTETAMAATDHFAIRPKSDLTFFYGLAHLLLRQGWIDRDYIAKHTEGFDAFAAHVATFTPQFVSQQSGISESELLRLARMIHEGQRVSFWWTMGVNQSHEGVRVAQSIINLALMTGNMGRAGTGANSITGQCNAMGSRLFSNTTNMLGGHEFTNQAHRAKVANLLHISIDRIPYRNSYAYNEIIEAIDRGEIKGLWMIATNPGHSWIDQSDFKRIIAKLDFFVVQDMYHNTETAAMAHLVLPAAGWGEKEGTFINSERRIGLTKKVAKAPGRALSDFAIFKLVADYWGCGDMFREWASPEAVFQIMKRLSRGQPCDITGIRDYQMLDSCEGIQWPFSEAAAAGGLPAQERRLFEDGRFFHPDGKAKMLFESPRRPAEPVDEAYPLQLLTGRGSASQWHTQTRTKKSAVLRKLYPQAIYVEMNPLDAAAMGIKPEEIVCVESRRGSLMAQAHITATLQRGQLFIPMHYEETNRLTFAEFDPYSKQPSYKTCAVRLRRGATS